MILTEEQQMIRDAAREFAQEQLAPNAGAWAAQGKVPVEVLQAMGELGFMGMTVPEKWGGANTDYVSYALALEEIAAGDGATSTIMSVNNAPVCAALLKEGSEEQKQELLIPLAKGALIGAFCLTESQAVNSPIQANPFRFKFSQIFPYTQKPCKTTR